MIATETMAAVIAVCIVCALLGAIFFWLEHNAKHELKMKENPLKLKWVVGAVLAGLTVAGAYLYRIRNGDVEWQDALCSCGVILGICSIFLAKIYNEGIGAFAKFLKQKSEEVLEAADDFSEVTANITALTAAVGSLAESVKANQDDMKQIKGRLGL